MRAATHAPADYRYKPEREQKRPDWLEALVYRVLGWFERQALPLRLRQRRFVELVQHLSDRHAAADDAALIEEARALGLRMRTEGFLDELVATQFSIVREVTRRVLGKAHYDCQLIGGWILLRGRVAEMQTGEGKTLTALLPVISAALAGVPVHVITVNDYLTARDAGELEPVYGYFGLKVGVIVHDHTPEERRQAYRCPIVYVTGKELVFDYLRDRMSQVKTHPLEMHVEFLLNPDRERKLQLRGLHFALVDEADSVLIDESRTPLIISGMVSNKEEQEFLQNGYALSFHLAQDQDYEVDRDRKTVEITREGSERIRQLSAGYGALWRSAVRRHEVVHKALLARLIYRRDHDYLVRDGKVELIDALSGRVMEGRSWERGLHQMVELKEECELTAQRTTLARISYQKFFRRYLFLCGMTGTAEEVGNELWGVYRLPVSRVPTRKPNIRETWPPRVLPDPDTQWREIVRQCAELVAMGRAVLIGVCSVASSELAHQHLQRAGIPHRVLNAKQDKEEADIVAGAGRSGQVTVATNMAGRGTDIKLDDTVREAGGLHVILTEHYESSRVDRQLAGRCARQGDPGSFQMLLSFEGQPWRSARTRSMANAARAVGLESAAGQKLALGALRLEQQFIERQNHLARQSTLEYDLKLAEMLSYSGKLE